MQDGVKETGVSVAFTVRAMDAGPVLAQSRVSVDPEIQAPELLDLLFDRGADLLLEKLPHVWSGKAAEAAVKQVSSDLTNFQTVCEVGCTVLIAPPRQEH